MKYKEIRKIDFITIILGLLILFLYEIGFCNLETILLDHSYNFSLYRIIVYIAIIFCFVKFGKNFREEAEKILYKKKKIILIYLVIATIITIYAFFKLNIYSFILFLLIIINGLLLILYITKDHIRNVIITSLTLGIMSSITIDVFHSVDEKRHFLSTINVTVGNFNFFEPITEETYHNIEFEYPMINFAMDYFSEKLDFKMQPIAPEEEIYSTPAEYNPILYLPASIGINIARLLGGSVADVFISGRIANVLTFCLLLTLIFKVLPFKKETFYAIYLIPSTFALAGTYSTDGITIGFIGLFIAYVFKLYKNGIHKINLKEFLVLLVLFVLTLPCKSGAYLGICLISFILPVVQIIKKDKRILGILIALIIAAVSIGLYETIKIGNAQNGDERVADTSPTQQIEYLIENPGHIITVYLNDIRLSLLDLGWYRDIDLVYFSGKYYSVIAFILVLYILYTALMDDSHTFKTKDKIIMFLAFLATFFVTTFVLYLVYTKVGSKTINGYQMRYIIPTLPLILSAINSKRVKKIQETTPYSKSALISGSIILVSLLLGVFR